MKVLESIVAELAQRDAADLSPLESRVERLELQHGERHVAVLNTLEKLNAQFRARDRERVKAARADDDGEGTEMPTRPEIVRPGPPQRAVMRTDHLAQRFRR